MYQEIHGLLHKRECLGAVARSVCVSCGMERGRLVRSLFGMQLEKRKAKGFTSGKHAK